MPSSMVFVLPQLNFGLVGVISSIVVLIQLHGLRMAMALIMFTNITQKLHQHGVLDVWGVGHTFFMYVGHHTLV